jgi:hypothetical protein
VELLRNLLVVAHLVGMAAVVGGYLVSLRSPAVPPAVVWGARAQLVTGLLLVGLLESGAIEDADPDRAKIGVKLLVALVVTGLAESQRRKDPVPSWAFHAIGLGALLNVLVAVLW